MLNLQTNQRIFEQQDGHTNIKIVINENRRPSGEHSRRYNSPLSDELAVLMPNNNMSNRDVVLHYRDGDLGHISELHWSYDPLQYQLRFCMVLMGGMSICNYRMVKS